MSDQIETTMTAEDHESFLADLQSNFTDNLSEKITKTAGDHLFDALTSSNHQEFSRYVLNACLDKNGKQIDFTMPDSGNGITVESHTEKESIVVQQVVEFVMPKEFIESNHPIVLESRDTIIGEYMQDHGITEPMEFNDARLIKLLSGTLNNIVKQARSDESSKTFINVIGAKPSVYNTEHNILAINQNPIKLYTRAFSYASEVGTAESYLDNCTVEITTELTSDASGDWCKVNIVYTNQFYRTAAIAKAIVTLEDAYDYIMEETLRDELKPIVFRPYEYEYNDSIFCVVVHELIDSRLMLTESITLNSMSFKEDDFEHIEAYFVLDDFRKQIMNDPGREIDVEYSYGTSSTDITGAPNIRGTYFNPNPQRYLDYVGNVSVAIGSMATAPGQNNGNIYVNINVAVIDADSFK